jgi:hypothetical protein
MTSAAGIASAPISLSAINYRLIRFMSGLDSRGGSFSGKHRLMSEKGFHRYRDLL